MKVALIGLGMVSGTYADAIRNSAAVDLTHVAARAPESQDAFLAAHPDLCAQPATVDQIANSTVDFVVLATPPNARIEIVERLAQAGKPILMEKPIERSLQNATALVQTCADAGVPLGIMLQHRARPIVADLRRVMETLGPLHMVEVSVPWWRDQAYYDEPGRGSYARDGGGILISQAIHSLDLMLSLAGPVTEVTAMAATTGFHAMEAEDFVSGGLAFANGAVGQVFATTASFPGKGEVITLHFAKGSAVLEAGLLRIDRRDGTSEVIGQSASSGAGGDPMAFTSDWHRAVIEDFADALIVGRDPLISGASALQVHKLIAALESAASTGHRTRLEDII